MTHYQYMQCRDPRDRIFGLLAISSDTRELKITPDYSTPAREIFIRTSVSFLKHYPDLQFLAHVCTLDNLSDSSCPSWALNIPRPANFTTLNLESGKFAPHPYVVFRSPPRFLSNPSVLVLKGRILDRISFCTTTFYPNPSVAYGVRDSIFVETILQQVMGMLQLLSYLGITIQNAASLCRVLIADPTWPPVLQKGRSATEQAAYYFWCYSRGIIQEAKVLAQVLDIDIEKAVAQADNIASSLAPLIPNLDNEHFRLHMPLVIQIIKLPWRFLIVSYQKAAHFAQLSRDAYAAA
jgi:hypothetical protein